MKNMITIYVLLVLFSTTGFSQDGPAIGESYFVSPDDIVWKVGPPTLPPGPQFCVVEGDIKKKGPIIIRLKLPAGYTIPPHSHPGPEHSTVLSGKYNMGIGKTVDKNNTTEMTVGSIALIPPGSVPHFGYTSEETIIQVHMQGPLEITYVNPEDDPRNK